MKKRQFTTVVKREGKVYVSHCPEFDIASQGNTVDQARSNLQEAVELFLKTADRSEIKRGHLRRLISEGIASGTPVPVDKAYWAAKRKQLRA
jgi:predicted RNase H-like HicB family nuclease